MIKFDIEVLSRVGNWENGGAFLDIDGLGGWGCRREISYGWAGGRIDGAYQNIQWIDVLQDIHGRLKKWNETRINI